MNTSGNASDTLGRNMFEFSNLYWSHLNHKEPAIRDFLTDDNVENQYWEHMTIVPILATIMLAVTVFLLVLFRQSPALVAGTVAGTLTIIGVYLVLNTISQHKAKYE